MENNIRLGGLEMGKFKSVELPVKNEFEELT